MVSLGVRLNQFTHVREVTSEHSFQLLGMRQRRRFIINRRCAPELAAN